MATVKPVTFLSFLTFLTFASSVNLPVNNINFVF
jgi:hypothetical protein